MAAFTSCLTMSTRSDMVKHDVSCDNQLHAARDGQLESCSLIGDMHAEQIDLACVGFDSQADIVRLHRCETLLVMMMSSSGTTSVRKDNTGVTHKT